MRRLIPSRAAGVLLLAGLAFTPFAMGAQASVAPCTARDTSGPSSANVALLTRASLDPTVGGAAVTYHVQPGVKFRTVGMCTIPVQHFDLRGEFDLVAENLDDPSSLENTTAQRVFGHEAHDQNGVARITRAGAQMVQDAPRFHHTRGRDNDHRAMHAVQRLRFVDIPRELHEREVEQVVRVTYQIFAVVEHFRVHLEYCRRVECQR